MPASLYIIPGHTLSQTASVSEYNDQKNSRAFTLLLPVFVICSCTEQQHCFDSVDNEQDVEEESVPHCKLPSAQDVLYHTCKGFHTSRNSIFEVLHLSRYSLIFHFYLNPNKPTSSIFFCISLNWLSHSLFSMSNLSSSSDFSLDQSLSLSSKRQRRSIAVVRVSSKSLRCSSLSLWRVGVSLCCSCARCADRTPPLIDPAPSLASN